MTERKHVLIVEDDQMMRGALAVALEADGAFGTTEAGSIAQVAQLMACDQRFDAILLDLVLPDGDGRELCRRLRRGGVRTPILMLTGAGDEGDVERGLDAGADDYVVKPFRLAELLARLRAQIRAYAGSEHVVLRIGRYDFRPGARLLHDTAGKRRIHLTGKETAVLKYLCRSDGRPVDRQTLLREVWGYVSDASTHTVETHIYRLRRKIEPDPARACILVNEEGGYCLRHDHQPALPECVAAN